MNEPQKASFTFDKFKVAHFSFTESESTSEKFNIKFDINGLYYQKTGKFEIYITFLTFEDTKELTPIIKIDSVSYFSFTEIIKLEEIPQYFYRNAIAIMFPYLRAFVSTLTLHANTKMTILPILNLSTLEQPLKEKTKVVDK